MKRVLATILSVAAAVAVAFVVFVSLPRANAAPGYTPPSLKVAVVKSAQSDDWANNYHHFGYGILEKEQRTYDYFVSRGWPNVTLESDAVFSSLASLQRYDVIVLPYVFCLDPTPAANLQKYVAAGGGVVSLLGVPRIAPMYHTVPSTEVPEHWCVVLQSSAWEWGPMSEVYQMRFINDPGAPKYRTVPWPNTTHAVLQGAKDILAARGLDNTDLTLDRTFSGAQGGGLELTTQLAGNSNAKPVLSFVVPDLAGNQLSQYPTLRSPGAYPAAYASQYLDGRSVYFSFSAEDFVMHSSNGAYWFGGLGSHKNSKGVPQVEIAGALMESAVVWAGADDGTKGPITRDGRTWATLSVYQDGIYGAQYTGAFGNVSNDGQAFFRIYDPSGKLVFSKRHAATYTGVYRGQTVKVNSYSYVPGSLKSGKYKVEVEYVFNYPAMSQRYKEVAYVVRGQGVGIKTKAVLPIASKPAAVSACVFGPKPITPNGDGLSDWGYITYSIDQPAVVTVKLYDLNWKLVGVPSIEVLHPAGRYSVRLDGSGYGKPLPSGAYYCSVQVFNSAGKGSGSDLMYVARVLGKAPALGTTPALSGVAATPSPFAPATGATTSLGFTLSADAWVTVKVLDTKGMEIRMLINNAKQLAGSRSTKWDGKNSSGSLMPAGTYRFYVFASSGGTSPKTAFANGTVQLTR